jgi:hypothetical protein
MTQTHRTAQYLPGWWIGGALLMGELSVYNTESLIMDHSGQNAWRVSCSLYPKDLISTFRFDFDLDFWCLTPLSTILQLYHGDQF